jgi:hypothetical protein
MGPGDGIQIQRLMDLPTTLETADQVGQQQQSPQQLHHQGGSQSSLSSSSQAGSASQQGVQRVKSMFQQSTGKLAQTGPGPRQPPPQRSVSHNEVKSKNIFSLYRLLTRISLWCQRWEHGFVQFALIVAGTFLFCLNALPSLTFLSHSPNAL